MLSLHTSTGIIALHPVRRDKTVIVTVKDADGVESSVTLDKRDVGTIASAMRAAVGLPLRKLSL